MFARYMVASLLVATSLSGVSGANDLVRSKADMLEELEASNIEWKANETQFRAERQGKQPDHESVQQFAEFVATLRRKMLTSCQAFRESGGNPDKLGFDCAVPEQRRAGQGAAASQPTSVPTREEQSAAMDAALARSADEFDKMLSAKREQVKSELAGQQSGQLQSTRGVERSAKGNSGGRTTNEGNARASSADGKSTSAPVADPGAGPGRPQAEALKGSAPAGIGGSADDVVAQQLKEAAEKEKDPILKEKLWNEYRKYKAS